MTTPTTPSRFWSEAVRAGRAEVRAVTAPAPRLWFGLCLKFVRTALGIPAVYPSAIAAWNGAEKRHTGNGTPPAGTPVFWAGGTYGHIALSVGGGRVLSTDILRRGKVDEVAIGTIQARWGLTYLGWTEDLNGRPVDFPGWSPPNIPPNPPPKDEDDMWTPEQAEKIEKRYVLAHQLWLAQVGPEMAVSQALASKLFAEGKDLPAVMTEVEKVWAAAVRAQQEGLEKLS